MATHDKKPVLISGAGPTGLVLALWLQRFEVPFRIVDKYPRRDSTSRAIVTHARTLELYRQLGIADEIIDAGILVTGGTINHSRKPRFSLKMAESGLGLTRFHTILSLPQDRHERVLEEILNKRAGGKQVVERGLAVVGFDEDDANDCVQVHLQRTPDESSTEGTPGEVETFAAAYVAGCDGAHSAVRHAAGVRMDGGTYARKFFVADITAHGRMASDQKHIQMAFGSEDFCVVAPLPEPGATRIAGFVPRDKEGDGVEVKFDDVRPSIVRNCDLTVDSVNWFSTYKVHHRFAQHFRYGRAFLVGDAAHLHSPAGGQGMNTGLGDATNLAWKLATVYARQHEPESSTFSADALMKTYETERIGFAKTLVSTTDFFFTLMTGSSWKSLLIRNYVIPYIMPWIFWLAGEKAAVQWFKGTSQIRIQYRDTSDLALPPDSYPKASAAAVAPGDRLPWVKHAVRKDAKLVEQTEGNDDNFAPLLSNKWHGQVYGEVSKEIAYLFKRSGLELVEYEWTPSVEGVELAKDTVYLVRPDGHVGAIFRPDVSVDENIRAMLSYCQKWGVTGTSAAEVK